MITQQTLQTEEYKQTELGELPKEWEVVKLKDLNLDISDGNYAANYPKQSDFVSEGIPFIRANNIKNLKIIWQDMKYITKKKHSELKKGHLKKGDILITTRGDLGNLAIVSPDFIDCNINAQLVRINPQNKLNSEFLLFFLSSYIIQEEIRGLKTGTALPQLPVGKLKTIPIIVPPPPEQQKIADVLSTVQTAQEKTQNFINSLKELKKSAMKHLFTYGAVSFEDVDKVELKETEIGMMPKSWETEPIKKYIIKTEQKDMRKTNIEFKYIDVSGIDREKSKIISYSNFKGKSSPSRARKIIKLNDIIIATVRPTLKRIAKIDPNYDGQICSTAFCVLRADERNMSSNYLFYNIHRDYFISELGRIQKGANYPAVSDSEIKNQKIQMPSLLEQQNIASILSAIDEKIQAEEQKKEALKETFNSLLKNLMTAKIRVNNLEVAV